MQITAGAQGDLICSHNRASEVDIVFGPDIRLLPGLDARVRPAQVVAIGVAASTTGRDGHANACVAVTDRRSDTDPIAAAFAGAGLRRGVGLRAQINGAVAVQAQILASADLAAGDADAGILITACNQIHIACTGDHGGCGHLQMLLAARFAFAAARHHADRDAGSLAWIFLDVAGCVGYGHR